MATTIAVARIDTPLGPMVAAATDRALVLLEFARPDEDGGDGAGDGVGAVARRLDARVVPGGNATTARTASALTRYFDGERDVFDLPLDLLGTPFQQRAWESLRRIPYGETRSYGEQAASIDRPRAVRAVAQANRANRIAIVVPCHRVIGADGSLTGYGAGVWRKEALLALER